MQLLFIRVREIERVRSLLLSFSSAFIGNPFFSFSYGLDSRLPGNDDGGQNSSFFSGSYTALGNQKSQIMSRRSKG